MTQYTTLLREKVCIVFWAHLYSRLLLQDRRPLATSSLVNRGCIQTVANPQTEYFRVAPLKLPLFEYEHLGTHRNE